MKALRLASAAIAVGTLLGTGSATKADEVTLKLGRGDNVTVEPAIVNKTLKLDANDRADVEQVWRRYYGGGYGGYRNYGYGGYGYRNYGYGGYGYRNYGYGGYYNYYRPYYGGYYNYYRPYYGYGYGGYGHGYGYRRWISDSGSSATVTLALPHVGVTVGKPWCEVAPPATNYQQPAPTLPAPKAIPPADGYHYDGGPANPVPMPKGTPAVPATPPATEESNENVTITAAYRISAPKPKAKPVKTLGYKAYGE